MARLLTILMPLYLHVPLSLAVTQCYSCDSTDNPLVPLFLLTCFTKVCPDTNSVCYIRQARDGSIKKGCTDYKYNGWFPAENTCPSDESSDFNCFTCEADLCNRATVVQVSLWCGAVFVLLMLCFN